MHSCHNPRDWLRLFVAESWFEVLPVEVVDEGVVAEVGCEGLKPVGSISR